MSAEIKLRRDTAANWASEDPTLALGEPGIDTTNRIFKVGDGVTAWSALDGFSLDAHVPLPAVEGTVGQALLIASLAPLVTAWDDVASDPTEIVLTVSDLSQATSTAPTRTAQTSWPVWSMQNTATTGVGSQLFLPDSWTTFDTAIWWTNLGAGAGNVRWLPAFGSAADGDTLGSASTGAEVLAAPAQNVIEVSTVDSGAANVVGKLMNVKIERNIGGGTDTLANAAGLIAVVLTKAS